MFLHDIPPVGSQDGLKINPLLITEAHKKNQARVLQFWQHLERFFFFFFQRAQCERDEPFKEKKKKNANLSTALFHPKANKWKLNPSSSKVPLSNLKDKRERRFNQLNYAVFGKIRMFNHSLSENIAAIIAFNFRDAGRKTVDGESASKPPRSRNPD